MVQGASTGYNFRMAGVLRRIHVKVLWFGALREACGNAEEVREVGEGIRLSELFEEFVARDPKLAGYRTSVVASRNQEFAAWDVPVRDGDEVAFLPPVSGG